MPIAVTIAVGALYCWLILYYSSNHQNTAEPAYQLVEKPTPKEDVQMDKNPAYSINDTQDTAEDHQDVQMDKNPAYSINDTQDTSEDHHYDYY